MSDDAMMIPVPMPFFMDHEDGARYYDVPREVADHIKAQDAEITRLREHNARLNDMLAGRVNDELLDENQAMEERIAALCEQLGAMQLLAQQAEAALRERLDAAAPERRTLGRALANAGYYAERERAEAAEAERDRLRACVEALEVEIAAARLFGGGYFGDVVKESTREVHRGLARAQMGKVTANDD